MRIEGPRQVVLITTRSKIDIMGKEEIKDNIITSDWHMPVSFKPKLYAIAIGKERFSHKLISSSDVFALNFIPYELEKQAIFCGTYSGEVLDKFKETGLNKKEAEKIDCPLIKEASAWIECKVVDKIDVGDHTIFIGEVLRQEIKDSKKRLFHTGDKEFTTTIK